MIVMEGMMLCPPERGIIIGRALWKPRYCVLGTGSPHHPDTAGPRSRKASKVPSKTSQVDLSLPESPHGTMLYITIYKSKGDWEYLQQHAVSAFKTCEIQPLQHRKQSPSLPTLMLELKPDSIADKQRKRRSSRSGGLSSKDQHPNVLLFRTAPDEQYTIYEWHTNVKALLTPEDPEDRPMSPFGPVFHNPFANPFGHRDIRSASSQKPELQQRTSFQHAHPHIPTHREKPSDVISPSPSLRSRRSDLSSQASSHPPMGFTASHPQQYTLPSDLPSPASTSGYEGQFIEGWTSAQGRSSALSSHTRGSNSIASAVASPMIASTPPAPRETILDRAFQMRCIPGGDRVTEEKLSSIARFEALMREVDERKDAKAHAKSPTSDRPNWADLEEESDESSEGEPEDDELGMSDEDIAISTPAQRALDYIAGRRAPAPTNRPLSPAPPPAPRRPTVPFLNSQAMSAFHGASTLRPRTGTTSSRKGESRPNSVALPSRSLSTNAVPTVKQEPAQCNSTQNLKASDAKEKRRSSTSVKRLSFTEFAKRLSSTSSLLLVQTNASSSSGPGDSRRVSIDEDEERGGLGMMGIRGGAGNTTDSIGNRDKRCGWRGSVGVFGGEGGFL